MSISRRHFVSGSALAAAGAAIPLTKAAAKSEGPLTEQEDIKTMLDIMERQIAKIRQELADSEAAPLKSADAVKMEACVFHHRANALAHRSNIVRKLALGETLAEQRAEYERLQKTRLHLGSFALGRLETIRSCGEMIATAESTPRQQQLYAATIARQSRALEKDLNRIFKALR